jgi:hypothetical protein
MMKYTQSAMFGERGKGKGEKLVPHERENRYIKYISPFWILDERILDFLNWY